MKTTSRAEVWAPTFNQALKQAQERGVALYADFFNPD
jgi:hypothetical protein